MRILMVSMFSIHFFRWTEQLRDSEHEIYWIDVFDSRTYVKRLNFVHQVTGWRFRVDFPGRYLIKKKWPRIDKVINKFNERDFESVFSSQIEKIQPDAIHSFVFQSGTLPLAKVMSKYPNVKWIYSAWGNDLYFRQQIDKDLWDIKETLPKLDYMFADCSRDYFVAKSHGFRGKYLGTFPTGGGYDLLEYEAFLIDPKDRNTILIKGYQGKLGRCCNVLKAILPLRKILKDHTIIVFGADDESVNCAEELGLTGWDNFIIKRKLNHREVLEMMGKAKIYIGNSISDGLPNTLLEAIIMEAFPIQSNPGGATSEIIAHEKNGLIIENPEKSEEIRDLIVRALSQEADIMKAIQHNTCHIRPFIEREYIRKQVLERYSDVEKEIIK